MYYCGKSVNGRIDSGDTSLVSALGPSGFGLFGRIEPEIGRNSTIEALSIGASSAIDETVLGLTGQITEILSLVGSLCDCGE